MNFFPDFSDYRTCNSGKPNPCGSGSSNLQKSALTNYERYLRSYHTGKLGTQPVKQVHYFENTLALPDLFQDPTLPWQTFNRTFTTNKITRIYRYRFPFLSSVWKKKTQKRYFLKYRYCCGSGYRGSAINWPPGSGSLLFYFY